jgi:SpoVK/Ycf46/Vps4 family AAA+-type ATPase
MSEQTKEDQPIVELLKTILSALPSILITDAKSRTRVIIASFAPIIINYAIKLAGYYKIFSENRVATVKFYDSYTFQSFFYTIDSIEPELIKSLEIDRIQIVNQKKNAKYICSNKLTFKPGLFSDVELVITSSHIDKVLENKLLASDETFVELLNELRDKKFIFKGEKADKDDPGKITTIVKGPSKKLVQKFVQFCVQYKNDYVTVDDYKDRFMCRVLLDDVCSDSIRVKKTFDNCFLSPENQKIKDLIIAWQSSKEYIIDHGLPYKKGLLLYGGPGNGKTSIAFALASMLNMDIYKIDLKMITRNRLEDYCTRLTNAVVLFDEIDMMLTGSHCDNEGKQLNKDVSADYVTTLMSLLDGSSALHECVIVFTTMNKEALPAALIRPGRIDAQFEFKNCIRSQFDDIYKYFFDEPPPSTISFVDYKYSVSHIINTIILPNLDKKDEVIRLIEAA